MSAVTSAPLQPLRAPARVSLPTACVPMLTTEGAMALLQCEREALLALVDTGDLTGVLDVSAGTGAMRELRFTRHCVDEWLAGQCVPRTDEELAELVFGTFARTAGRLKRNAARRRLLVCASTTINLTRLRGPRRLCLAPGSRSRRGPGGSPEIAWPELVRFCASRRLDTALETCARTPSPMSIPAR